MKKKKRFPRRFNPQWHIGKPRLPLANGIRWCIACRESPQPGMHPSWQIGTTQLRRATVVDHGNFGVHAVAVALGKLVVLPPRSSVAYPYQCAAIFGMFHLVYGLVKRYGSFTDLAADAATATMVVGAVVQAYRSPLAAREIMHSFAAPIRTARGEGIMQLSFFALASDSSTDWGANNQELVYAQKVPMGRSRIFFVRLHDLQAGTAVAILAVYKQVMLHAGLPVDQWMGRGF